MKEQAPSFEEITKIDTSDPNWQIKTLNDSGLIGSIVSANQRMGIHNEENFQSYLHSARSTLPVFTGQGFSSTWRSITELTHESGSKKIEKTKKTFYSRIIGTKHDRKLRATQKESQLLALSSIMQNSREEFLTPLQEGSLLSFLAASIKIRWDWDSEKLKQLAEDVSVLNSAYNEMERRGIS